MFKNYNCLTFLTKFLEPMKNSTKFMIAASILGCSVMTANAVEVVKEFDLSLTKTLTPDYEAEGFEFDAEEVMTLLGIDSMDDAIVVSLKEDGEVASQTANNGYWYNNEGEVVAWGEEGFSFYIEYRWNEEDAEAEDLNYWFLGNNPEAVALETTCNIGFMNEENVVLFNVAVTLEAEDLGELKVVKTYDLSYASEPKADYGTGTLAFDSSEVLSLLGCESLDQARIVSLDSDNQVLNQTGNNGYWYNYDGEVCGWGDGAAWFIEYQGDDVWTIGNYPTVEEAEGVCNIGFLYEDSIVLFEVNVYIGPNPEAGVESLFNDVNTVNKVYNLQGVKINVKDLNDLNNGLYIINGKKVLVRK